MPFHITKCLGAKGFTLAEVMVAMAVVVLFGAAAFTTNQRLLVALKTQKETTAANMMLQARMETFRALSYSNVCDATYVSTNVVQVPPTAGNGVRVEEPLGLLTEQITVSGYLLDPQGTASTHVNRWQRNATYPSGNAIDTNSHLVMDASTPPVPQYDLVKVDILLTWTSTNGRGRTRNLSSIFGKGNIGP
jgi:prepilin-type N-terminal cleavage/methylation domain-containing protein